MAKTKRDPSGKRDSTKTALIVNIFLFVCDPICYHFYKRGNPKKVCTLITSVKKTKQDVI